jgi:hypothetical protein
MRHSSTSTKPDVDVVAMLSGPNPETAISKRLFEVRYLMSLRQILAEVFQPEKSEAAAFKKAGL